MTSKLEKARETRLRVSRYYANSWEFIIRILMGIGIYVVIRITFAAVLMKRYELSFSLTAAPSELLILILSALLFILTIQRKENRLRLVASVWMPALSCFALVEWMRFFIALFAENFTYAFAGILPFVLPLSILIIFWVREARNKTLRKLQGVLVIIICLFWIYDVPVTLRYVRNLDSAITRYTDFYHILQKDHIVPASLLSSGEDTVGIYHTLDTKTVQIGDYLLDETLPAIEKLEYINEMEIIIPGRSTALPVSYREMRFPELDRTDYHYLYKYTVQRHILIRDFQFSGDGFFRALTENGEKLFLSNVAVRKK
jgi:hypothetical protein